MGRTAQTLRQVFTSDASLNQEAARVIENILTNGARTAPNLPRYGAVIQYQLQGGFGARWLAATGEVIGFINP